MVIVKCKQIYFKRVSFRLQIQITQFLHCCVHLLNIMSFAEYNVMWQSTQIIGILLP